MDINYVELGSICKKGSSNVAQKDLSDHKGKYPIYGASGFIMNVDFAHQNKPYLAVVIDGAGVGRVMLLPANSSVIGTMQYILPNDNVDIDYLFYALQYMNLSKYYSGATIPHIYFKDYQREKILLPSLDIQRKKAEVLHKIDRLKNWYNEYIVKFDTLIKSRFIEMFGDPLANPFKWNVKLIEDVVASSKNSLKSGPFGSALKKEYYVKSGYKVYGQEQVISGNFKVGNYYIDEKRYKILENYAIQEGDVLISLVGTYGKLLIMSDNFEPGIINPRLLKITFDKSKVNSIYFKYYFESESLKKALSENTHGGTMAILNLSIVRKLAMPLPSLELQNQFAAFAQQVNKSELAVKASLEKLETLKKSLMQQYFG